MANIEKAEAFDKEYAFYEERCEELKNFLEKSESKTSKALFQEALDITDENIQVFLLLSKEALKYHAQFNNETKVTLNNFKIEIADIKSKITDFNSSKFDNSKKAKLRVKYEQRIDQLVNEINFKGSLHDLELDMRLKTYSSLKDLIFNHIFKPNSMDFKYEIILDVFKKIIQKMIPGSEEVETILSLSVKNQKYQSISSADRVNIYIEKYIDVSKLWNYYADLYLKTLQ